MLRLKKIEEQITPERSRVKTHRDSNMFFEHYISNSKITIFDEERSCLDIIFSLKYRLPRPLEVQYIEVDETPILLRTFDLKKCIISERTWGIMEYKVLKS